MNAVKRCLALFAATLVVGACGGDPTAGDAGTDLSIGLPTPATLDGTASDDGKPLPANLTTTWSKVSGPGTVTFNDASAADTTATFSAPGNYVLRLVAGDGEVQTFDETTVTTTAPTVTVQAGDPTATEFGLTTGAVTIPRNGTNSSAS